MAVLFNHSNRFQTLSFVGVGCASIYYEHVPQSSKYLLWNSLVLTHNRPFDFCQGWLQSACQWVAVVHTGSMLGLEMCRGVNGTSQLTGGENTKACWFSKLISINYGPVVVSRFKTHAAVKQDSSHLQGVAWRTWRRTWRWLGQLGRKMLWEGRTPSKNPAHQAKGGLAISWLHCSWWQNSCCRQRGQDFTLCVHPVDTGPDSKGRWIFWLLGT